jgi:AraC family transcriptional regulator of arabinose operon
MRRDAPRREGFSGQHLLVLPEPLSSLSRRHPLLRGLCVTDAGYFPSAKHHLVERPKGAATTLIILCLGGSGWVRAEGETWEVGAGDFVWLPANRAHAYGAGKGDPWTIVWAHFTGEEVAAWGDLLRVLGQAQSPLLTLPDDRLDEIALDHVYGALERGYAVMNQVAAAAALRHSLSAVAASIETLRHDWQRPHRLDELATAAKASIAHYSALFRRQTGFSPIDFLIRLRVRHACRLLDTTTMPVGEVGMRTGFHDPYYFTRCFRRVMGRAPRAYRRVPKG